MSAALNSIPRDAKGRIDPEYVPVDAETLEACLSDWHWRIYSGQLYKILVKSSEDDDVGQVMPFRPNDAQRAFLERIHHRNVILKARQLGFSTLICILWLDHALFVPNQACGIVAHNLEAAESLMRDKVKFALRHLPADLRARFPLEVDNQSEIVFAHNGSRFRVATSLRSGTYQRVHISELGKISAKYPEKAREVMTGTLPTVPADGIAVVESTAEGRQGEFFELSTRAEKLAQAGVRLARTQWRFHFFPWWKAREYQEDPSRASITPKEHEYFDQIEADMGVLISNAQRAWYVLKRDADLNGSEELMWQEYPSTPAEAFQQSTEGTYYAKQITAARVQRRITDLPIVDGNPAFTFWDIGAGDGTGIWVMQHNGPWFDFVRYIEGWDHGYSHYIKELRETGLLFSRHFLPHDGAHQRQMGDKIASPRDVLSEIAPDWSFEIVPRVHDLQNGIQLVRKAFPQCRFDTAGCKEGLEHIELYRKVWNQRQQRWGDRPEKGDGHSEAADAFRQFAQALENGETFSGRTQTRPRRRNTSGMAA